VAIKSGDKQKVAIKSGDKQKVATGTTKDSGQDGGQDGGQDSGQDERLSSLLEYCCVPRGRDEIQQHYGVSSRDYFRNKVLKPLLESGQLKMTIPDKPSSGNQKYVRSTE